MVSAMRKRELSIKRRLPAVCMCLLLVWAVLSILTLVDCGPRKPAASGGRDQRGKPDKVDKVEKADKADKVEKAEKADKGDKGVKQDKQAKPDDKPRQTVKDGCVGATCEYRDTCGKAPLNPMKYPSVRYSQYIVGGQSQKYGEFPAFAKLLFRYYDTEAEKKEISLCGGVLLTDRHIMTGAHCVHTPYGEKIGPEGAIVFLGDDKPAKDAHELNITGGVESICVSSNFKREVIGNVKHSLYDFAVLTLKEKVKFTDYIQPACLPYESHHRLGPGEVTPCFAIGSGMMGFKDKTPIRAPAVQKIPVVTGDCTKPFFHDSSRMCVKHVNNTGNACVGDSGGPIMCLFPGSRWVVGGLMSYGPPQCKPYDDRPKTDPWLSVAARVFPLMKHIKYDCKL